MKVGMVLLAIAAGVGAGAGVFFVVGNEQLGAEVKTLVGRFGVNARPGDTSALDFVERVAPGPRAGFESAVITSVAATLLVTTVVTLAVREIAS
jgi:hypothetical protein